MFWKQKQEDHCGFKATLGGLEQIKGGATRGFGRESTGTTGITNTQVCSSSTR